MANLYASLTELKLALGIGTTDTADDTLLTVNLEAASREIDAYCARHFYQDTATRYFSAENASTCFVDDLVSVTTLSTDDTGARSYSTTWATTDYDLCPVNAASRGEPFTWIDLTPNTTQAFPTAARAVKIVGVFGYPGTLPYQVKEATLIQAARFHMRQHAPFGVVGNADMGQLQVIPKLDPDVALLLSGLRRPGAYGI